MFSLLVGIVDISVDDVDNNSYVHDEVKELDVYHAFKGEKFAQGKMGK